MNLALRCLHAFCLLSAFVSFGQDVLIAVKKDGKWSYVNTSGTSVIPGPFDEAYPFYSGMAVAIDKGQYGLIDATGKWVVAQTKGSTQGVINSNRVVCANEAGKWGAIDTKGKVRVPFEKDIMSAFQSGWALAGEKTSTADLYRVAVIDTLGKIVVNFDNTYLTGKSIAGGKKVREGYVSVLVAGDFAEALAPSTEQLDGKPLHYAMMDVKNKRLVNFKITSLDAELTEGRFNMAVDGIAYSWSQPLPADPVVSEAKFSFLSPVIYPFSGGIAAVQKEGKWAYIDKDGSLLSETNLTPEEYMNEKPVYTGGFVIFWKKGGMGIYTDLNGHQKVPLEFEELQPFRSGAAVVKYKGKYGLVQKDGSWALPAEFEGIRF